MKYANKLDDMLGARKVPAQVRRIAIGVATEADDEIAALQARCAALEAALVVSSDIMRETVRGFVESQRVIAQTRLNDALIVCSYAPAEGEKA